MKRFDDFKNIKRQTEDPQVVQLAEYLGIDPFNEPQLMYLAKQALNAPIPKAWEKKRGRMGEIYFLNRQTGEQTQQNPVYLQYYDQIERVRNKKLKEQIKKNSSKQFFSQKEKQISSQLVFQVPKSLKKQDPLLNLQKERKKTALQRQEQKQLQEWQSKQEENFEKKRKDLLSQYKNKQIQLKKKVQKQAKQKFKALFQARQKQALLDKKKNSAQISKYQQELRADLQQSFKKRLSAEQQNLRLKAKQTVERKKRQMLQQHQSQKRALEETLNKKLQTKKNQLQNLKNKLRNFQNQTELQLKAYRETLVQKALQEKKQELLEACRKVDWQVGEEISQLQRSYQKKLQSLAVVKPKQRSVQFDQKAFRRECQSEYRKKVQSFQNDLKTIAQIQSLNNEQKLRELEASERALWQAKLNQALQFREHQITAAKLCNQDLIALRQAEIEKQSAEKLLQLKEQLENSFRVRVKNLKIENTSSKVEVERLKNLKNQISSLNQSASLIRHQVEDLQRKNQLQQTQLKALLKNSPNFSSSVSALLNAIDQIQLS